MTIIPCKAFVEAVAACATCLERDPLRHHPGRMRIARTANALVLSTATRTEKVGMTFRIPCEPGDTWAAALDAEGTSRLAKALKGASTGRPKKAGNGAGVEIERAGASLVVSLGGQRTTLHAGDPPDEEPGLPETDAKTVAGAADLVSRIEAAMPFCAPGEYRDIAKGPFLYFRDANDGSLSVAVVVVTDGHRLLVDGDARDCPDASVVLRVSGELWPSAVRALDASSERVRLVRTAIPCPAEEEEAGGKPPEKHLDYLAFESADREVRILLEEPQVSLPCWASFLPSETDPAGFDIVCNRSDLARAVKSAGTGSRLATKSFMLKALPSRGMLRIRGEGDGSATEQELEAEIRGASTACVHLNPKYVADALGAVSTEKVRIRQIHPPLDPVRLLEVPVEGVALRPRGIIVMPIRGTDPPEAEAAGDSAGAQVAAS